MKQFQDKKLSWKQLANRYNKIFTKKNGIYDLKDLTFKVYANEKKGSVEIYLKGKKLPGMADIICEKGKWKVDER